MPDGSAAPAPVDDIRVYQPSTRPGSPLPHAWIDDEDGQAWCEAARQLAAEADIPLDVVRIGHLDGNLYDPRCGWLRHRQIAGDGTVLVPPDRFIAWRSLAGASEPRAAFTQILARPSGTPAVSGV